LKKYLPHLAILAFAAIVIGATPADKSKTYSVTADTIEGCSCPLFCTCYFSKSADEHMCQFNNVYKFQPGSHYGDVDLSNQLFWMSGDLGGEWHHKPGPGMPTNWVVISLDKKSSPAQKKAIEAIANASIFNTKWKKYEVREDTIEWHDDAKMSHAKLGSGMAEITLNKFIGPDKKTPTVLVHELEQGIRAGEFDAQFQRRAQVQPHEPQRVQHHLVGPGRRQADGDEGGRERGARAHPLRRDFDR
jgi:hypothetical protein